MTTLFQSRKREIRRQFNLCQRHLLAADAAEARGMTERAKMLRGYALVHYRAAEIEQDLIDDMRRRECASAFEQEDLQGNVTAAQPEPARPAPMKRRREKRERVKPVQLNLLMEVAA